MASSANGPSPRRSPPPESISTGARGLDLTGRIGPRARLGVGRELLLHGYIAVRGEGGHPAHLRACRRRQVLLAAGPRVDAADRPDGRPREHAGHAWTQAP